MPPTSPPAGSRPCIPPTSSPTRTATRSTPRAATGPWTKAAAISPTTPRTTRSRRSASTALINAVVNKGDVAALSQIQQIQDQAFKVTGGEMDTLNGLTYLVVGQDFEGEYNPGTTTGFSQTYIDEIQAFNINYNGQVPNSLSHLQLPGAERPGNLRRRDYNLGNVVLPNGQPALEIYGGVFTPGPGTLATQGAGYRNPILIRGIGDTQVLPYQQTFNQYSSPHIGLFDPSTGSMDTIFLGGISLYDVNFATGQLTLPLFNFSPYPAALPFVNAVTTLVQQANGTTQEFEMANQLPGLCGSEARFFASARTAPVRRRRVRSRPVARPADHARLYVRRDRFDTWALQPTRRRRRWPRTPFIKIVLVPNGGRATNTTLVDSLYQVLLGRSPTTAEQNYWVTWLNAGQSTTHVALAFDRIRRSIGPGTGLLLQRVSERATRLRLRAVLSERVRSRATEQQVIAQILSSPQFALVASGGGPTNNGSTVASLYTDLLNRGPTDSEETSGTAELNAGTPVSTLINSIMTSNEYLTDEVDADYTIYLGHLADSGLRTARSQSPAARVERAIHGEPYGVPGLLLQSSGVDRPKKVDGDHFGRDRSESSHFRALRK